MNFMQKLLSVPPGREEVKFIFFTFPPYPFPLTHRPKGFLLGLVRNTLMGLLVLSPTTVLAGSGARTVYSQDAQGINSAGIALKVWRGYGLTINFIPTGETIKQVWIGDPSRISLTSNGNLCQKNSNSSNNDTENCGSGNATVIFLRQIKPIAFPNMTTSSDGSTLCTVITSGSDGQKQYQFKLIPATGQPSYTSLVIKPDSERPLPAVRTKPSFVSTLPTTTSNKTSAIPLTPTPLTTPKPVVQQRLSAVTSRNSLPRNDANAVVSGLAFAHRNGQVKSGSTTWNKAQDAIKLLRLGKTREEAVSRSGIDEKVFNQLIEWGRQ